VLAQNSITTIPQGTKFIKVVAAAQALTEAAPVIDWPADELPDSGTYIQYIVELKHALPRDVVPALQPLAKMPQSIIAIDSNSLLVLRDYSSNVRRMLQMLAKLDKPPKREFGSSRK
jgi:type II secretory pathway component GspD/PulD (secretin)